jgi:hypothetical protein
MAFPIAAIACARYFARLLCQERGQPVSVTGAFCFWGSAILVLNNFMSLLLPLEVRPFINPIQYVLICISLYVIFWELPLGAAVGHTIGDSSPISRMAKRSWLIAAGTLFAAAVSMLVVVPWLMAGRYIHEGFLDNVDSLKNVNAEQARWLVAATKYDDFNNYELHLEGLRSLSPGVASEIAKFQGKLYLDGLVTLSPEDAATLASRRHDTHLLGLRELSGDAAESLSRLGRYLRLGHPRISGPISNNAQSVLGNAFTPTPTVLDGLSPLDSLRPRPLDGLSPLDSLRPRPPTKPKKAVRRD